MPALRRLPLAVVLLLASVAGVGCAHAPGHRAEPLTAKPSTSAESASVPATPPPAAESPRQEEAPRPDVLVTVAAVGDVMLGSTYPEASKGSLLPPDDGAELLAEVAPVLQAADVTFGNLEGPLLDSGPSEKCRRAAAGRCYAFRSPERYGQHLASAGFDVLSLANNHVGDFGDLGRARTREVLDRLGLRYTGALGEVATVEVRGARLSFVAFSVSAGTNDLLDVEGAARTVAELRARGDLVIVSFHGGAEGAAHQHVPAGAESFYGEARGDLRRFAHAVVDAGAALVLGHGPHVVRGLELYRGRLVAYSLGNFATYGGMNLSGPNGLTLVLEVQLAPDGSFHGGFVHPVKQERPGGPQWDTTGAIVPLLRQLSREDFGPAAPDLADDGTLSTPAAVPVASCYRRAEARGMRSGSIRP